MSAVVAQSQTLKIALLKYSGGGDWYANPTSLPNLVKFCNQNLKTNIHIGILLFDFCTGTADTLFTDFANVFIFIISS